MSGNQKARAALAKLCRLRLQALGGRATAREIAADLGKPLTNILPRFSDLQRDGLIRDTGLRVRGLRGRPQVIWADVNTTHPVNDRLACITDATALSDGSVESAEITAAPDWFTRFGQ